MSSYTSGTGSDSFTTEDSFSADSSAPDSEASSLPRGKQAGKQAEGKSLRKSSLVPDDPKLRLVFDKFSKGRFTVKLADLDTMTTELGLSISSKQLGIMKAQFDLDGSVRPLNTGL